MYTKECLVGFETFLWGPLDIGVSMDINDCGENFSDRIYVSEPSSRTVYHLIAPAKLRYKTPKLRYKTQSSSFSGVDISSWHQRESKQYHIPLRTGGYISPENTSRKIICALSCRTAQVVPYSPSGIGREWCQLWVFRCAWCSWSLYRKNLSELLKF